MILILRSLLFFVTYQEPRGISNRVKTYSLELFNGSGVWRLKLTNDFFVEGYSIRYFFNYFTISFIIFTFTLLHTNTHLSIKYLFILIFVPNRSLDFQSMMTVWYFGDVSLIFIGVILCDLKWINSSIFYLFVIKIFEMVHKRGWKIEDFDVIIVDISNYYLFNLLFINQKDFRIIRENVC